MNIQDITDFIDLVKNPEKYEKVLSNIKKEQERLNEVIATVGKASELNAMKANLEKRTAELEKIFEQRVKELDEQVANEVTVLVTKQKTAQEEVAKAVQEQQKAFVEQAQAQALVKSFEGRDKAIRLQEQQLQERQTALDKLIAEYNEKVTKLRSVMG